MLDKIYRTHKKLKIVVIGVMLSLLFLPVLICEAVDEKPHIYDIAVKFLVNGFCVYWKTDIPADSQAEYGLNEELGTFSALKPALTKDHSVEIITGPPQVAAYYYRVKSNAGRQTFTSDINIVDFIQPAAIITSPLEGEKLSGRAVINCAVNDSLEGIRVEFYIDDSLKRITGAAPYNFSWDTAETQNGPHRISVFVFDKAGNAGKTELNIIVKNRIPDTTPPVVRIISPEDGAVVFGQELVLKAEVQDESGIKTVDFLCDNKVFGSALKAPYKIIDLIGDYEPGHHIYQVRARDMEGNTGESSPITVSINELVHDTTPPVTRDNYKYKEIWVNQDAHITLTAADSESGVARTCYNVDGAVKEGTDIIITTEGRHTVTYGSVDNAGNKEAVCAISVWIDKTPPVTRASLKPGPDIKGWINTSPVKVSFSGTDDLSGIKNVTPDTEITVDGVHHIPYQSLDNAGNLEESKTLTVNVDTTAPVTVAKVLPAPGKDSWHNTLPVNVTFVTTDDGSGVMKSTPNIEIVNEGEYEPVYQSVDNAGNEEPEKRLVINIDVTPPEVSISAKPSVLWPINNKPVKVVVMGSVADNISGVESKVFKVTDEYNEVQGDPKGCPLTDFGQTIELVAGRKEGDTDGRKYTIQVTVTDKAGNSTIKETTVTVPYSTVNWLIKKFKAGQSP